MDSNFDYRLFLLSYPIVLFSLCVHEWAHSYTAHKGGDDTSRLLGRMTINPLAHVDPVGTVLMPIIAATSGLPLIGWAKPVPVNPTRLRSRKWDLYVTIAGPLSNLALFLAIMFIGKVIGLVAGAGSFGTAVASIPSQPLSEVVSIMVVYGIIINLSLALFNMIPIAPLDGSKVLFHYAVDGRPNLYPLWEQFERYGFLILYALMFLTPLRSVMGYLIGSIFHYVRILLG